MFQEGKFQSSLKNSHRRENFGFSCREMHIINYNIDAYSTMFETYRVKVSENRQFERKECFSEAPLPKSLTAVL